MSGVEDVQVESWTRESCLQEPELPLLGTSLYTSTQTYWGIRAKLYLADYLMINIYNLKEIETLVHGL